VALPLAACHAAMTYLRPRNALDGNLEPWKSWGCDSAATCGPKIRFT